ncbi:hypothetical protein C3Z14_13865 [Proteus mirabilis]|uniref:Abortive infection bacteriophage resistance protein n=2 Tax=Proteus mirabilis TaxID=584 RepID=A0AAN1C030_PROMI|nr:Abi family protein [Proteus mirabilis]ARX33905.1 hypothetical protein AM402_06995 [Proteus mirabilis]AVA41037.1 hypothetical protein C3Z14_13865 [Proteus mirabilis]EJD6527151.1 Abi family protein [Proteus mirabilis]EJD6693251.1 Abi family protein [Proteus mirabilis]ELB1034404.1 Abi family protein [Proteus mirabilis]
MGLSFIYYLIIFHAAMHPLKPHLTYFDQIKKLEKRGMSFEDLPPEQAVKKIMNIGYYRLSGYWYPFRKLKLIPPVAPDEARREETFLEGTTFTTVYAHYLFDVKLRSSIFYGIERIETYLKAKIAYELGKVSPTAYKDKNIIQYRHHYRHDTWLEKLDSLIERNSDKDCIRWNLDKYGDIPIWAIVDIWDFGTMSRFYGMLEDKYKHQICKSLGFLKPNSANVRDGLKTALEHLNTVRNRCAHHARLWNTDFSDSKISIEVLDNIDLTASRLSPKSPELSRMAGIIFLIWSLTKRISCNSTWLSSVNDHLEKHQGVIPFNSMGFDNNNISGLKNLLDKEKEQSAQS